MRLINEQLTRGKLISLGYEPISITIYLARTSSDGYEYKSNIDPNGSKSYWRKKTGSTPPHTPPKPATSSTIPVSTPATSGGRVPSPTPRPRTTKRCSSYTEIFTTADDIVTKGKKVKICERGFIVYRIQDYLYQNGYKDFSSNQNPDGVFGPATEKMIKKFQSDKGLIATGEVDDKTWLKLTEKVVSPVVPIVVPPKPDVIDYSDEGEELDLFYNEF